MELPAKLRNFRLPTFWRRSNVSAAAERIRARQEELLGARSAQSRACDVDIGCLDFSPRSESRRAAANPAYVEPEPVRAEPKRRTFFSGLDAKSLVLVVSLAVNGYLVVGASDKNAVTDEIQDLKWKVSKLEKERREVSGKILRPGEVAVPKETFDAVLAESITSLERSLKAERENLSRLEAEIRSVKKPVSKEAPKSAERTVLSERSAPAAAPVSRVAPEVSNILSSANAALSKIPGGSKLRAAKTGRGTVVLYTDDSGYRRFFTWEHSENAGRRSVEGLLEWGKTMNLESSLRIA